MVFLHLEMKLHFLRLFVVFSPMQISVFAFKAGMEHKVMCSTNQAPAHVFNVKLKLKSSFISQIESSFSMERFLIKFKIFSNSYFGFKSTYLCLVEPTISKYVSFMPDDVPLLVLFSHGTKN